MALIMFIKPITMRTPIEQCSLIMYMQQGSAWDYSTENVEVIPVSVHGMKGQMFLTDDWEHEWNTITWIDAQNNIQFSIDGNFDADDILHIAESVSLVNSTK